jgi:membrane protein involved in colicin uptake
MLPLLLALAGCGSSSSREQEMAAKLAAAEAAADRAVAAQHAAEKAAVDAANSHSNVSTPTVVSDTADEFSGDAQDDGDSGDSGGGPELSMGGPGQTIAPDGTVIPGV